MAPREQLLTYLPHGKAAMQYPISYSKRQTVHGNTDLLLQWNRKVAQKVDACLSATTDSIKGSALWSNNGSSLQTTHHCSTEDITSNELLWCAERRERSMEVSTWELCPPQGKMTQSGSSHLKCKQYGGEEWLGMRCAQTLGQFGTGTNTFAANFHQVWVCCYYKVWLLL